MRASLATTRCGSLHPRGVTLLELLIVMTIMIMITAATLPLILPAFQNRQLGECSRLVSSYISGARSRAIETGRPVGVVFERLNGLSFANRLSYVEVPLPYAGDSLASKIVVSPTGRVKNFLTSDVQWMNMIRYGDLVKLDFRGASYVLASQVSLPDPKAGTVVTGLPSATTWQLLTSTGVPPNLPPAYDTQPPPNVTTGVAFQIFRQPVRSPITPLQLPAGVGVDLHNSGMGLSTTTWYDTSLIPPVVSVDPVIIFTPTGSVSHVTQSPIPLPMPPLWQLMPATGPLFFLIGRRELMSDVRTTMPMMPAPDLNLFDPATNRHLDNYWVIIGPQTGLITTTENLATSASVVATRTLVRSVQGTGG